jgi:hypothetical protein
LGLLVPGILFIALWKIHYRNNFLVRVVPFCYTILAYYGHRKVLFSSLFDNPDYISKVSMDKDELYKMIIMFSALSMNLIYIGMFLSIKRIDCKI